jgi:hypothetical protein
MLIEECRAYGQKKFKPRSEKGVTMKSKIIPSTPFMSSTFHPEKSRPCPAVSPIGCGMLSFCANIHYFLL